MLASSVVGKLANVNAQMRTSPVGVPHDEQEAATSDKWVMKKLMPWHRDMCSMLAQGIERRTIAAILDCTPEYVSMLCGQQLVKDEIARFSAFAGLQLEAQFTKSVAAIGDTLENGNHKEKMMAARLQMEATKRIGSRAIEPEKLVDSNNRLTKLSERLLGLLDKAQSQPQQIHVEVIQDGQGEDVEAAEDGAFQDRRPNQSAQADGNGHAS